MNCGIPGCQIKCHHPRKETGRGWAKCLDCGSGYGWPGIIPEDTPDLVLGAPVADALLAEGDVLTVIFTDNV